MPLKDVIAEVRQEIAGAGSGINEADAKAALITPILAELGWRGLQRIRSEYPVDQGRMRLDYALMGSGTKPVGLIEAKAPREDLESHVAQVLNYAFHEGVDVCILTTGVEWWLFLPREKGSPAERRFAEFDIRRDDLDAVTALFSECLEHRALISGDGERYAKKVLASRQMEVRLRKEIPLAWQRLLSGPSDILVELLQEEVHEALGVKPSEELIKNQLRAIVSGQRPNAETENVAKQIPPQSDRPPWPPANSVRPTKPGKRPPANVKEVRLWGEVHRIGPAYEVLLAVAEMVYARHSLDFRRVLDLAKYHTDPSECRAPYLIADSGIYVDRHMSFNDVRRTSRSLLEFFGHDAEELEIVLDE